MPLWGWRGGGNLADCEDPTAHLRMCEERQGTVGFNFGAQEKFGEEEEKETERGTDTHRALRAHPPGAGASNSRRERLHPSVGASLLL